MPTLETPAGKPIDVTPAVADQINRDFNAAMNDDGPQESAPPRRRPDPAGDAESPKRRRGRPPKSEQARTAPAAAAPVKDDYTADAQSSVGTVWAVTAGISFTQPYALVIEANSDQLVAALAEGAKHNATIRRFVSSGGSSGWVLSLASVSLTMGVQAMELMRDPELRAEAAATTREHLKDAIAAKGIHVPEPANEPAAA
jgi:hypothetical protein